MNIEEAFMKWLAELNDRIARTFGVGISGEQLVLAISTWELATDGKVVHQS